MDLFYEGIEYRLPADSIPWTAFMNHQHQCFHLNRVTIETSPTGRCMTSFFYTDHAKGAQLPLHTVPALICQSESKYNKPEASSLCSQMGLSPCFTSAIRRFRT